MIVEDEDDAAEVLAVALRRVGYRVMSVPNGHDAMALLLLGSIDLVVADLRMPQMDGVTLVTVIRSYVRFQSLPIIVCSAYADGPTGQRLRDLCVSDVFLKGSADLQDVVRAVGRHLRPPSPETGTN